MLTDTHTHLAGFSSDGRQTVEQLLSHAARKKLAGICVTDHYEKDVFYTPGVEEIFSISEYFASLEPLRQQTAHQSLTCTLVLSWAICRILQMTISSWSSSGRLIRL
jgi:histidinol phosphatase-like PHP family hydrolase